MSFIFLLYFLFSSSRDADKSLGSSRESRIGIIFNRSLDTNMNDVKLEILTDGEVAIVEYASCA